MKRRTIKKPVKEELLKTVVELAREKKALPRVEDVAHRAKVQGSILYRYFEDKRDLLFTALEGEARAFYQNLTDSLNGIKDPLSRLSRFIWVWLEQCEKNEWFLRLLYFSCFSTPEFYRHQLFKTMGKCPEEIEAALKEGMSSGDFPANLPIAVVRDMIMGLLDMECVYYLAVPSPGKATDRFDECFRLVESLLRRDQVMEAKRTDKRKAILDAVERAVATGASDKMTTAFIAGEAGVSEGTIYNYFRDKEDMFLSSIRRRLELLTYMREDFFKQSSPVSKLIRFIFYHFTVYLRYPAAVKTFVLKGIFCEQFYSSGLMKDYERYLSIVDEIIDEGKSAGLMNPLVQSETLKKMMTGLFVRMAQLWFSSEKEAATEIMSRFHLVINLVLRAVLADEKKLRWLAEMLND